MTSHEMRNMVLNKSIRKVLSMSACIEAEKTDVKTDNDGSEFNLTYGVESFEKRMIFSIFIVKGGIRATRKKAAQYVAQMQVCLRESVS
jgi:hypothetical protein